MDFYFAKNVIENNNTILYWIYMKSDNNNTILSGYDNNGVVYDNGSLDEFVNTEVYYIDDLSINRKGGYLDRWKASLRIIRYISF